VRRRRSSALGVEDGFSVEKPACRRERMVDVPGRFLPEIAAAPIGQHIAADCDPEHGPRCTVCSARTARRWPAQLSAAIRCSASDRAVVSRGAMRTRATVQDQQQAFHALPVSAPPLRASHRRNQKSV